MPMYSESSEYPNSIDCSAEDKAVGLKSDTQVGGSHYKLPIQPIDYIYKNGLGYMEGNIIKYVTRHKTKNGKEDLEKAKHYIEMLIEREYSNV